jgi:thiamine pyrophosphokinase
MSFRMDNAVVESHHGVTLVGGGPVGGRLLARALALAPGLVAADGGADRALALGHVPQAVIGDMDSLSDVARQRLADRLHPVAEQETTDFDKALRMIRAPFVLGLGFAGARVDHGLAVLNALVRHPDRRCVILSGQDATFLAPPRLVLRLPVGTRLSLFPMGQVSGRSTGLRWPIEGLRFAPDAMIGTSNEVASPQVTLDFDAARMLVILPIARLRAALGALVPPPPVRGG